MNFFQAKQEENKEFRNKQQWKSKKGVYWGKFIKSWQIKLLWLVSKIEEKDTDMLRKSTRLQKVQRKIEAQKKNTFTL